MTSDERELLLLTSAITAAYAEDILVKFLASGELHDDTYQEAKEKLDRLTRLTIRIEAYDDPHQH